METQETFGSAAWSQQPHQEIVVADAIADLKAQYYRLMDAKRWDEWCELLAPHAVVDMSVEPAAIRSAGLRVPEDLAMKWQGLEEIRAAVPGVMAGFAFSHHWRMQELERLSPTRARGTWSIADMVRRKNGIGVKGYRGFGHDSDVYVSDGARWFIESTTRTRQLILPFV